jgi:tetratricopeptide (TPR) repeat protein
MKNIEFLESIEAMIVKGELKEARAALLTIRPKQVSGPDLVYFCSLLRRSDLALKAVQVLQPLVYPKSRSAYQATVDEKLEYASNLVRLEILGEADRILQSIDENLHPTVLIRRGFLLVSKWDFAASNICFEKYIRHPLAHSYDILIAKVNWLQGLVYLEKSEDAWVLARELIKSLDPGKHKLLLAAVHEFCAELCRLEKNFERSLDFIEKAKFYLEDHQTLDGYLIRKQEAIVRAYWKQSVEALLLSKKEAEEKKHFESLRDLDLHIAVLSKNEKLLNQVYWRTQSVAYRGKTLHYAKHYGLAVNTDFFRFRKNKGVVFHLDSQLLNGTSTSLKKDKALSKLLQVLLTENYKPLKLIDLFCAVYEDEIFFPDSSADKTHQLLKRLRQFLEHSHLPIKVICRNRTYSLMVYGNFSLQRTDRFHFQWERSLFQRIRLETFDISKAQQIWGCSLRTTLRRIDLLKKGERLRTTGQTRARKFQFCGQ